MSARADTYRAAVEILVEREVALARPNNPGAYAGSVRSRLLNDKRDLARALMEHEIPTPEALAEALDDTPDVPAPKPTVRHVSEREGCATCGCYGGGGWLDAPARDELGMTADLIPCPSCAADRHRLHAREHVTEDRADVHAKHAVSVQAQRAIRAQLDTTKEQRA